MRRLFHINELLNKLILNLMGFQLSNYTMFSYLQLVILRPVALDAGETLLVKDLSFLDDLFGLEDRASTPGTTLAARLGLDLRRVRVQVRAGRSDWQRKLILF